MSQQQRKMRGPFTPVPGEIIDLLQPIGLNVLGAYVALLNGFFVEENLEDDEIWITGIIKSSRMKIAEKLGKDRQRFNEVVWKKMEEAGVVELINSKTVKIPMLYKKADIYISPLDLQRKILKLVKRVSELEGLISSENSENDKKGEKPGRFASKAGALRPGFRGITPRKKQPVSLLGYRDIDHEEEEEGEKSAKLSQNQENSHLNWIIKQIDNLWVGRGVQYPNDDEYLTELEKYTQKELEAAFKKAIEKKAKYGNYAFLLNFLRNPDLYQGKKKSKSKTKTADGSYDGGALDAPWWNGKEE